MAEWAPSFLVDGVPPGSATIDTLFNGARSTVNALDRNALHRGAINRFLAPQLIPATGSNSEIAVAEWSAVTPHIYDDAVMLSSMRWTTFGADGGAAVGQVNTGDRFVIGNSNATNPTSVLAQVDLSAGTGFKLGMNDSGLVQWVLVIFDIDICNLYNNANNSDVVIALQYRAGAVAAFQGMQKAERSYNRNTMKITPNSSTEQMWVPASIFTAITSTSITADGFVPATDAVKTIRAMATVKGGAVGSLLALGSFRLTAIPMLSSMVSG